VTYIDDYEFEDPLWIGETGDHEYYTLLDEPQSPMTVPWTDVLDYACDWASGQTGSSGVATAVTQGIYYIGDTDGDIDYDPASHYCDDYRIFRLTSFLSDIKSSSSVQVNCSDVGNLFNIFSAALGLSSQSKRIMKTNSPYYFLTNSIDPIGSPDWNTTSWWYHQYGWFVSKVDDACLRVNQESPLLPSNMTQGTYNGYLLASGYGYNQTDTGVASVY
jgi:hypothetical protein